MTNRTLVRVRVGVRVRAWMKIYIPVLRTRNYYRDFNINWRDEVERRSLYNLMINENGLEQLISSCTTDNETLIDHLYTNLIHEDVQAGTLETYIGDHKAIWASIKVIK